MDKTEERPFKLWTRDGAEDRSRTDDLLITNQLLYQLSYFGPLSDCIVALVEGKVEPRTSRRPHVEKNEPSEGWKSCGKHGINPTKHPEKTGVRGNEKAKKKRK